MTREEEEKEKETEKVSGDAMMVVVVVVVRTSGRQLQREYMATLAAAADSVPWQHTASQSVVVAFWLT